MPPKARPSTLRQPRSRRKTPTDTRLLKGCLLAVGAAGILMFSFVTVGMELEGGPGGLLRRFAPPEPRTVVSAPIAVDLGGYSISPGKRDRYVWVTVAMKVPGPRQEAEICRMMPRLRAVIVQELGDKMRETPDDTGAAAPALIDFARARITRALDTDVGREFGLLVLTDWRGAPYPSCPRETEDEM
ncbi:MAG: hypothetical protein RIG67_23240 [Rhodospirillales bacterium]